MAFFKKESNNLCERLVDNANVLMFYLDKQGDVLLCNKKVEDFTALPEKSIIGNNWLDVLYGSDNTAIQKQMFKAVMDDVVTNKRSNNFDGLFINSNKSERHIFWNISPLFNGQDNEIEGILLIGNDFTEAKAKEASYKKIDDTFKDIFASIKEYALFVTNLKSNITYYGMGSEVMFGWEKNDIVFKDIKVLLTEETQNNDLPFIIEQATTKGRYEAEVELRKKDGSTFPVILTVNQFLDVDGKLSGFIFIAKDITERKKLEYQIFQSEKLAAIGQLAAGMAHEINNPIFVISGRAEMLLENPDLSEKVRLNIGVINTQADRIRKLVDNLLKFSKHNSQQFQELNINDLIEGVLPLLTYHKLPSYDIEIEKAFSANMKLIKGDQNQLQEVFINLFINAFQAMPKGGKLRISTRNIDNKLAEVRISDNGAGIEAKHIKDIFMPFFSTKKEGTGLGLSICYNIIKDHNGDISVETAPNKGTTFIVKIPFV